MLTWMHDGNGDLLFCQQWRGSHRYIKEQVAWSGGPFGSLSDLSFWRGSPVVSSLSLIAVLCSNTINSRRGERGGQTSNLELGFGYGIGVSMEEGMPSVERIKGPKGVEKILLREIRGVSIEVSLYGGQVISWKNLSEELLFVSSKAGFKPPKPIRGGIQICFPQVGIHGVAEQQGFARTHLWVIEENAPAFPTKTAIKSFVDLILKPSEEELKNWPHRCEFRLRIALSPGGELILTSRVRNTSTDGKALSFSFAYLTYFQVSDISEVRVEGLETLDYLDFLKGRDNRFTEQGDAIVFESEVDKVYLGAPPKIAIIDHEKKRTFVLAKDGLPDIVVWNPWDKKAKAIPDLGDEEYKHMLCVGAAAVEKPITLKPGEEWTGRQEISAVPSSYCSGQLDPAKVIQMSIEATSSNS